MKVIEKHMSFHELKESLSRGDCPICFLAERSVSRNIEDLFHEKVNDPGVAKELKRSGGFCEKHSEQILRTNETLGIAIIYKRLLDVLISHLKHLLRCNQRHNLLLTKPSNLSPLRQTQFAHKNTPKPRQTQDPPDEYGPILT